MSCQEIWTYPGQILGNWCISHLIRNHVAVLLSARAGSGDNLVQSSRVTIRVLYGHVSDAVDHLGHNIAYVIYKEHFRQWVNKSSAIFDIAIHWFTRTTYASIFPWGHVICNISIHMVASLHL